MSKIVSFRLSDDLIPVALKKLGLTDDNWSLFTSQLNNAAYSLMLQWLTDDRQKDKPDLHQLISDLTSDLTFNLSKLESKIDSFKPVNGDYEELMRERDRLDDRVSELLNQIDELKLERVD